MALLDRKLFVGVREGAGESRESCGRCEEGVGIADRRVLLWDSFDDCPERFSMLPAVDEDRDHPGRVPAVDKGPARNASVHPVDPYLSMNRSGVAHSP